MDHDLPINVIVLEDVQKENESLIDGYIEIVKSCKKVGELRAALTMICSEQRELTLREILIRRIQSDAKLLEETKNK